MSARRHRYVGPAEIRDRPRGPAGAVIRAREELLAWLQAHPEGVTEGATYVVDPAGDLRVAPRRSEHIDCAGGGEVLAAGELRFTRAGGVAAVTNLSTGYCPDPDCWPAVAAALAAAGLAVPARFTQAFVFRRCPRCGQTNVIKEGWFVCACCDGELPAAWNFAEA